MKKLFSIVLAVVMVLGVAASAMAFNWTRPADADATKFGYEIDVIKFTRSTSALGSSSFNADDNATAVNGADVYFAIKLVVNDPDDDVKNVAEAVVNFTALSDSTGAGLPAETKIANSKIKNLKDGVWYYDLKTKEFKDITYFIANVGGNKVAETPVTTAVCADTDTAKVKAKITAKTPIPTLADLEVGDYKIQITATNVIFKDSGGTVADFARDGKGKVTSVTQSSDGQKVAKLYQWLNAGSADAIYKAIKDGEMYMTDDNLRAAFGMNFSSSDSATWKANSAPIILDPNAGTAGIGIPKTGDASSVVGFAMIMVAIVAAAVAVKKVKA